MSKMIKIGLMQVAHGISPDVGVRQEALLTLARKCLDDGAELVFFPEAYQYAAVRDGLSPMKLSETYAEEWKGRCAELAREYRAYVVPWDYWVDSAEGKVYNTSYVLDRDGEEIGRYRKCNLTYAELKCGLTCGKEIPVFELDICRLGIMICFDNYFPEVAATLGNKGAQLVLYPLYGDTLKPQWELKLRTRAADHSFYVASSQIGDMDIAFSALVDPEGNVIKKLESYGSYCVAEIEPGRAVHTNTAADRNSKGENLREYLHKCRNPEAFGELMSVGTSPLEWNEIYY